MLNFYPLPYRDLAIANGKGARDLSSDKSLVVITI
jgi:hypothetical protein